MMPTSDTNEVERSRPELALAAALHLLSSSVARGITAAKTQALVQHLQHLAADPSLDPALRQVCKQLRAQWAGTLTSHCAGCALPATYH
ncbi:hypothetical protein [Niveibacterium microcysteis]|uniref:Uncharacterized protein n=1 Tax=Niveibacterium microcysteis TaxID=2811415 RepID=A0ABX7MCQ4_9RHOO|nr:hypothetical protein [Niveibacterium microcysteis]QSI78598.1 hypothetical protein JY500_08335 [Niveibacterium microcysteis]